MQFSDFQCPFCSRVEPTINQVMDEYKGKVRVAWRDLPLPFHPNAMPAAIAARAAGEQGKFWEMHDKIFANQQHSTAPTSRSTRGELGLNMGKFKAALDAQKGKEAIEADAAAGGKIGARGTPAFFINGKFLSGAQPFEAFKAKIDEELKNADALVAKGTPKAKVYDALMKDAKTEVPAAPAAPRGGAEKGPEAGHQGLQGRGRRLAVEGAEERAAPGRHLLRLPVPVLPRVEPTLTQIEKEYAGKVRFVWKNYPLPFHNNAEPAAEAAMAAARAGQVLADARQAVREPAGARPRRPSRSTPRSSASTWPSSRPTSTRGKYKAPIESETKEGQAVGVNGTPAVFINGRKISGAYPFETFKKIADEELAKKTGKKQAAKRTRADGRAGRRPAPPRVYTRPTC